MMASVVNAAAVSPAANWPLAAVAGRCDDRHRADAERKRRQANQRRQDAPDDEQGAQKSTWEDLDAI